jgi:hypothetical protein
MDLLVVTLLIIVSACGSWDALLVYSACGPDMCSAAACTRLELGRVLRLWLQAREDSVYTGAVSCEVLDCKVVWSFTIAVANLERSR